MAGAIRDLLLWGVTILAIGALVAFYAMRDWWLTRKAERAQAKAETLEDSHERVEAGRKAVSAGRGAGSPDDRLRANDSRW